jgi:hypothetical protein
MANWKVEGATLSEDLEQIKTVDYSIEYEHSHTYASEEITPLPKTSTESELIAGIKASLGDTKVQELDTDTSVPVQDLWRSFPITEKTAEEETAIDAAAAREVRDSLLAETDFYALSDVTMSDEMSAYRVSLRNIPQQEGFPSSISWPTKP